MLIDEQHLDDLKSGDVLVISHPDIDDLRMTIRRDEIVENFLGVGVIMTSDRFKIEDNDGTIHLDPGVSYDSYEMVAYVARLCEVSTIELFRYVKNMERYGLREDDVIEFVDGSRGQVIMPDFPIYANNVLYIPFKKDGTLSKVKPRMLYGNVSFKRVR